MSQPNLSQLTDAELLVEAKKMKKESIIQAFIIGFLIGIILFSVFYKSVGWFTLIPLYMIFKVFHNPERNKALKQVLKERGLDLS